LHQSYLTLPGAVFRMRTLHAYSMLAYQRRSDSAHAPSSPRTTSIPLHIIAVSIVPAPFLMTMNHVSCLQALQVVAQAQAVAVPGDVRMTNHVHLLVSAEWPGAVSRMMQAVGRRYVRAFNAKYRRTGTLWEGRYQSCL